MTDIHKLSDMEIADELGRNGWYTESVGASRAEVDIAVLQEGVRRLLMRAIAEDYREE